MLQVRQDIETITLYWALNFLCTYWCIREVLPTLSVKRRLQNLIDNVSAIHRSGTAEFVNTGQWTENLPTVAKNDDLQQYFLAVRHDAFRH